MKSELDSILTYAVGIGFWLAMGLVSCKTELEAVYTSHDLIEEGVFTSGVEGPAIHPAGDLLAVNFQEQGTIGRVDPDGNASLFKKLPDGSTGNGIRIGSEGEIYVADYTGHNVLVIDAVTLEIEVYVHSDSMNQPNDLAIAEDGTLYLSDPNWSASTGQLWRVDTEGNLSLVEKGMGTTNGIEVSASEKILYVNESVQRSVWAYDILEDGQLTNKRLHIQFDDYGLDGMRCDAAGNLHITRHGKGTVAVVSPKGDLLKEIELHGEQPTNIAFGGQDGKTCFITMMDRGNIEFYRTEHPGREWVLAQKRQ